MPKYSYYNRDLSWLSFNYRVLQEAKDDTNPLYERIKFLAIYSNNLEEFYQVRVSYYRQLIENDRFIPEGFGEKNPAKIIRKINERVSKYQAEFHEIFNKQIVPELRKNGIHLLEKGAKLAENQLEFFRKKLLNC